MAVESRGEARTPINRKVNIIQSDGSVVYAKACDISHGGICIISDLGCDPEHQFNISLNLTIEKEAMPIRARVEARYIHLVGGEDKFRIGARFVDFVGAGQDHLDTYIQKRQNKPQFI